MSKYDMLKYIVGESNREDVAVIGFFFGMLFERSGMFWSTILLVAFFIYLSLIWEYRIDKEESDE